jgi:CheY-like chemotaxis protein
MLPKDGKVILYVDDEPAALKYFEQLFGDEFRIVTSPSGEHAWNYVNEHAEQIAVLITDQRMGEVSGVELMDRVRVRFPSIVRVLITAFTQLEYAVRAVNEGGAFRYLTKPIDEQELIGTLMRACEFHAMTTERDRLLKEKLSVLHRLVVMDRIRGLAAATTTLEGQLRGAWSALASYMEQSPAKQRIRVQLEEIVQLNLSAIAKQELKRMVQSLTTILADTVAVSTGDESAVDVAEVARQIVDAKRTELLEDDLDLVFNSDESVLDAADRGMLEQLVKLLIRRMADIQEQPAQLDLSVQKRDGGVAIEIRGRFRSLGEDQVASFFAAAMPLEKWPIGFDMDLLSAFFIVHHHGGKLRIEPELPSGPGIKISLPQRIPADLKSRRLPEIRDEWFEAVYDSTESWQEEVINEGTL